MLAYLHTYLSPILFLIHILLILCSDDAGKQMKEVKYAKLKH